MKTVKNIKLKNNEYHPLYREKQILRFIKDYSGDALIRKGNFSTEIIYGKRSFMFPAQKIENKGNKKGLFLFSMVRKDAKLFLKEGKKIRLPKQYPVNQYNDNFQGFEYRITGTDLNHAYWRIAYNLGIITKATYIKGLDNDFKVVRLAALSTLGTGKEYQVIKNGVVTDELIKVGVDEDMKLLYKIIRYTCYKYMQQIKKLLKDDFVAYRTDCIYYVDKPENRKLVKDFCNKNEMLYKQLYGDKKALYKEGDESSKQSN